MSNFLREYVYWGEDGFSPHVPKSFSKLSDAKAEKFLRAYVDSFDGRLQILTAAVNATPGFKRAKIGCSARTLSILAKWVVATIPSEPAGPVPLPETVWLQPPKDPAIRKAIEAIPMRRGEVRLVPGPLAISVQMDISVVLARIYESRYRRMRRRARWVVSKHPLPHNCVNQPGLDVADKRYGERRPVLVAGFLINRAIHGQPLGKF